MSAMPHLDLTIEGMNCQGCVRSVEKAVRQQDPDADIAIDLAAGRARIVTGQPRERIVAAIEAAGYDVAGA